MGSISIGLRNAAVCSVSVAALLAASGFIISPAFAQTTQLPGVTIYSTTPQLPSGGSGGGDGGDQQPVSSSTSIADPDSPARPPSIGDGGEFLRHINGVEAGRQGGHGLEPTIRGLDQNQLSITNDGAFHFGGCPNRMDPPTSHMQLYTYDKVIVKKGYQSVIDGPPAPGGSIQFERVNPTFAPGMGVTTHFKAGGGYNSNGHGKEAFVDMSMGNDWGYIRAFGSYGTANNYEDGDGNTIRSSFDQYGGGVILGRTFDADSWVTLKIENNNVDDALFPGSGMDAPLTDDWTYQVKGATDLDWGMIKGVKGNIYLTTVDHIMNNFDLRPQAGSFFEADMESDTLGGKIVFNGALGGTSFDFGADYRDVLRDGDKDGAPNGNFNPVLVSSVLWPDTSIKELGLFGEAVIPLSEPTKLTVGLRFSHVNASADRADQATVFGPAPTRTPNQAYQAIYGSNANDDKTENNISGLIRLEHELGDGLTVFAAGSRSVRTADATERYIANFMGMPGGFASWVGNPDIDPEQHHQADLGMTYKGSAFDFSGSVYYNSVTDYIQRYINQNVGGVYTNASVYRNIDATLAGVEAKAELRLNHVLRVNLAGSYTYGENRTDDVALAQISPLNGRFEFTYDNSKLLAGVRVNATATQTRVDDNSATGSGLDFGETSGWVTVDLFSSYNITENFQVSAGVTNLFDRTYANHLNKESLGELVRVNEPGRSFYIRGVSKF